MLSRFHLIPERYVQTDRFAISILRVSMLTHDKNAYHQIEVKPEHQWLTAFVWDGGLYQYTRAPFGQKRSGNSFVRAVQQVLYPIRELQHHLLMI